MGFIQAGTHIDSSLATKTLTVPTGTLPSHTALVVASGSSSAGAIPTGASITGSNQNMVFNTFLTLQGGNTGTLGGINIGNEYIVAWTVTGMTAGDTFQVYIPSNASLCSHYYFDTQIVAPTVAGARNNVSQAFQTSPAITVTPGQTVGILALERTTATPTTVSSVVTSQGRTVAQRDYRESAAGGASSHFIGEYVEPTNNTGTITITYSGGSTNGMIVPFLEVDPIYLGSGTPNESSTTNRSVVVPAGITVNHTALLVLSGSVGAPTSASVASPGTATTLQPITTISSEYVAAWKVTGVKTGDTIMVNTVGGGSLSLLTHHYFASDFGTVGALGVKSTSTNTAVAPSMTVTAGSRMYVIGTDRSSALDNVASATNSNSRTVNTIYNYKAQTNGQTSTFIGQFTEPTTITGTSTVTWTSPGGGTSASLNGAAFQIVSLPPVVAPPPQATVDFGYVSGVDTTSIRAGYQVSNVTTARILVSASSNLGAPTFSAFVTPSAAGWITAKVTGLTPGAKYYVGIEANNVLLTTGRLTATTLKTGPLSYVALTGSCQKTGSNHPVLAKMATENAAFFAHQGDLHYGDTSNEAAWRGAFALSMGSTNMKALTAAFPMFYGWDNHDWAGQGSYETSWDLTNHPAKFIRELSGDYPAAKEIYRTWVHGRVRWIKLDQWSQRSNETDAESSTKNMMSPAQEQWLFDTLTNAGEPLIIVLSSWPMYNIPGGRWGSFTTQTTRIRNWLAARPSLMSRMVAIGGDSHAVHADDGTTPLASNMNVWGPIPSLNASPLNEAGGLPAQPWNIGKIDIDDARGAYSKVTITDHGGDINFQWDAVQDDGTVLLTWSKVFASASAPVTVNQQVQASLDDIVYNTLTPGTGYYDNNSTILRCGNLTSTDYDRSFALRFSNLQVPQGATILSATVTLLQMPVVPNAGQGYPTINLKAEDSDNAAQIPNQITAINRPRITPVVTWTPPLSPASGNPAVTTPDIKSLVQAIVNRPGWTAGNAMQLYFEDAQPGYDATVSHADFVPWDGIPTNSAPIVNITYQVGGFVPSVGVTKWDGTKEVPVQSMRWDGFSSAPLGSAWKRHRVFTVDNDLLSGQPFYVAHRGGSATWPESTQYAYRQAAAWPMKMLEISAFVSSDGVWVSSHDQSTARITGTDLDIPTTPWSSLSQLTVAPPSTGPNGISAPRQPLSRVVDILNDFAHDHVIFIEDKSYKNQQALIDLIKTYPNYKQHFIWKCSGPSTSTGADLAKAAGLKSWGYYFTGADMTGLFGTGATNSLRYDFLGIDSACTDAEMNQLVALNRPFTSHILTTTAQRDRMRGFGAIGHMCANIQIVVPPQ